MTLNFVLSVPNVKTIFFFNAKWKHRYLIQFGVKIITE